MKKGGLALLIFVFCNILLGGVDGSGTEVNPFYEIITDNAECDPADYDGSTIYIYDLVISTGFSLTLMGSLSPGHLDCFDKVYSLTINKGFENFV